MHTNNFRFLSYYFKKLLVFLPSYLENVMRELFRTMIWTLSGYSVLLYLTSVPLMQKQVAVFLLTWISA